MVIIHAQIPKAGTSIGILTLLSQPTGCLYQQSTPQYSETAMSNDRELLELAAKAYADANVNFDGLSFVRFIGRNEDLGCNVMVTWNPLLDDGDALRLAVKLRMQLSIGDGGMVTAYAADAVQGYAEDVTEDVAYCTRRAIVRAAASIGEQMK